MTKFLSDFKRYLGITKPLSPSGRSIFEQQLYTYNFEQELNKLGITTTNNKDFNLHILRNYVSKNKQLRNLLYKLGLDTSQFKNKNDLVNAITNFQLNKFNLEEQTKSQRAERKRLESEQKQRRKEIGIARKQEAYRKLIAKSKIHISIEHEDLIYEYIGYEITKYDEYYLPIPIPITQTIKNLIDVSRYNIHYTLEINTEKVGLIQNIAEEFYGRKIKANNALYLFMSHELFIAIKNIDILPKSIVNRKKIIQSVLEQKKERQKKEVMETREFIDFLRSYGNIEGEICEVPYEIENMSLEKGRCLESYIKQKCYKTKLSKLIDNFFKNDWSIARLIEFIQEHKLGSNLYNVVAHRFHNSKKGEGVKIGNFNLLFYQNHCYPVKGTMKNFELCKKDATKDMGFVRNIDKNYITPLKNFEKLIAKNFIDTNFIYSSEKNMKILALNKSFKEEDLKKSLFAIDMNKSYFNMTMNILDENMQIGIANGSDLIEKFDENMEIVETYYYFLDDEALDILNKYGYQNNLMLGYNVNYLLEQYIITKKNIIEYKSTSTTITVRKFRKLIAKSMGFIKEYKLSIDSWLTKNNNNRFRILNGLFGKTIINHSSIFVIQRYISDKEIMLINNTIKNYEYVIDHRYSCKIKGKTVELTKIYIINKQQESVGFVKDFNNVNYYNFIVGMTNLQMLKTIFDLKDKTGLLPLKIKTDGLVYNTSIPLPEHFKIEEKICTKIQVYNKSKINTEIIKEEQVNMLEMFIYYLTGLDDKPGSGKSEELKKSIYEIDFKSAPTNKLARNMGGTTHYQTFNMYDPYNGHRNFQKFKGKTIHIDEYAMTNGSILTRALIAVLRHGAKIVLTGDRNQLSPIKEEGLHKKRFFKAIVSKLKSLGTQYRYTKQLEQLLDKILITEDLKELINNIKTKEEVSISNYNIHLTYTNRKRRKINNKIFLERREIDNPFNKEKIPLADMNIRIKPKISMKKDDIYKGDIFQVIKIWDDEVLIRDVERKEKKFIDIKQLDNFELAFALTTCSVQGSTIDEKYVIHETDRMDKKLLYTALSRGTMNENIKIL
jgi:hypothetical protein